MSASARNRGLEVLQWFGMLGAALAWTSQHVLGFGITQAAAVPAVAAGTSKRHVADRASPPAPAGSSSPPRRLRSLVFRRTRGSDYQGAPPLGRMQFFSIAAMVANVLFLCIVTLDAIASVYGYGCRQS